MSYQSNRYQRRRPEPRRTRHRALGCLVAVVWLVLALVIGYQYFLRPRVSEIMGREMARQIGAGPPGATAAPGPIQGAVDEALPTAGAALPAAVAALPTGELRMTEEEANAFIAENPEALGPLDSLRIRFGDGVVQAEVSAFRLSAVATTELAIQAGRIVAVNPRLEGPISSFISADDLVAPIEQQLNDELAAQGRRITDVRVEPGVLIVTVE